MCVVHKWLTLAVDADRSLSEELSFDDVDRFWPAPTSQTDRRFACWGEAKPYVVVFGTHAPDADGDVGRDKSTVSPNLANKQDASCIY